MLHTTLILLQYSHLVVWWLPGKLTWRRICRGRSSPTRARPRQPGSHTRALCCARATGAGRPQRPSRACTRRCAWPASCAPRSCCRVPRLVTVNAQPHMCVLLCAVRFPKRCMGCPPLLLKWATAHLACSMWKIVANLRCREMCTCTPLILSVAGAVGAVQGGQPGMPGYRSCAPARDTGQGRCEQPGRAGAGLRLSTKLASQRASALRMGMTNR